MPEYGSTPLTTFNGGLITEAGELTFPENASIDELNCDLLKDGSRRRRLGVEYETADVVNTDISVAPNTVVSNHKWENVSEQAGVDFVVVQVGASLLFFEQADGQALSANRVPTSFSDSTPYVLDLEAYRRPDSLSSALEKIQVASLKGALVVASPEINTILVQRDEATGVFSVEEIFFEVRDYEWQGDIENYRDPVPQADVATVRIYDTKNAGWSDGPDDVGDDALSTYLSAETAYPALTHSWFSGKNASGNFAVAEWQKVYAGTSLIPNGHYLMDLYSKDRHTPSGISGTFMNTVESSRFSTVASFAGRMFYSGMKNSTDDNGSKVFFSQVILSGFSRIGSLHQLNDPTSEVLADLLDTDGGFISIPEAYNIQKLHVFGPDLYVFAQNGVWRIGGVDDVFRATDYTVSKLSSDGLLEAGSFVSAQGRPYWWSTSGIFTLAPNEVGGLTAVSLSVSTIQTFWDAVNKENISSVYDATYRRVFWFYKGTNETNDNKFNEILVYDEVLSAFFPWRVSDSDTDVSYIAGATFSAGIGSGIEEVQVVDSDGNEVVDSNGNFVIVERTGRQLSSSKIKLLAVDGPTLGITFAEFTGKDFKDWDGSAAYDSYVEGAHNFLGDMETRKTAPYVTVFMKTTEEGWSEDEGQQSYSLVRESGCLLSALWDFSKTTRATAQQVYRRKFFPSPSESTTNNDYPRDTIVTRVKLRGRGRSVRLKFVSEEGKDFHILGYNMIGAGNGRF